MTPQDKLLTATAGRGCILSLIAMAVSDANFKLCIALIALACLDMLGSLYRCYQIDKKEGAEDF